MCQAMQNQVLCRFFCTIGVGICSGILTPNMMELRCQQRGVASTMACTNLCYADALIYGPVTLSAMVWWITARECAMNSCASTQVRPNSSYPRGTLGCTLPAYINRHLKEYWSRGFLQARCPSCHLTNTVTTSDMNNNKQQGQHGAKYGTKSGSK